MERVEVERLVAQVRTALAASDEAACHAALAALAPVSAEVSPVDAVDLLERACVLGSRATVEATYDAFPEFVYEGWALALALRCARGDIARLLLDRGVDLLGDVRPPTTFRALLPHEGTFTRFDLTRKSPTLFLNPMDPTVSTEVFEPFRGRANESLAKPAYEVPTDLPATCELVAQLAAEGRFDAVVFDDLLRAALVRAGRLLRHEGRRAATDAETCLALAARMLELHATHGQGDRTIRLILGNLIVPKVHPRIVEFVCDEAPDVFLERLAALSWLQRDVDLVARMVAHLAPSTEERNGQLVLTLARAGRVAELEHLVGWDQTLTKTNVTRALEAASAAGHAEAAAWLLAHLPADEGPVSGDALLGELLL